MKKKDIEDYCGSFFETYPDAMLIADMKTGMIIDANQKAAFMLSRPRRELVGKHFSRFHTEAEKKKATEIFRFFSDPTIAGKEDYSFEVDFASPTGEKIPVKASVREIIIEGESHLLGIFHDIEEKRRLQRELYLSRQQYRDLYDNARIGLYRSSISDGTLLACNWKLAEILGYPDVASCLNEFTAQKHYADPDDRQRILALLKNQHAQELEIQIRQCDGTVRWGNYSIRADWEKGFLEGSVSDITEKKIVDEKLKESQSMLEAVFEGIHDPIVLLDSDYHVRIMNRAAFRYYNISPDKPIKTLCHELKYDRNEPCQDCRILDAVKNGVTCHFERKSRLYPGRFEAVTVYPLTHETGSEKRGAIVKTQDITYQKKVEDQLIRADRLSAMGQFSAGIAHEIRNPLSCITLFIENLSDMEIFKRHSEEMEMLEGIIENINRIEEIIKKVLQLTRRELKEPKPLDIKKTIESSLKMVEDRLIKSNIRLVRKIEPGLPVTLGDAIQLEQVLLNLMINSIDAMNNGGEMYISARADTASFLGNRPVIRIQVADSGPGVSPEIKGKLFDPFYTTKPNGTGLGLPISQRIIERHGGIISCDDRVGGGAIFEFVLPVERPSDN